MKRSGFTILEVMIAVVILAIGLSALFASEAGAIRMAQKARTSTIATLLARCKMAEVEEKVFKEGWPGEIIEGRDECCEDGEKDGYTCEWKVERIKLPDLQDEGEDGKSGSKSSSSSSSSSKSGSSSSSSSGGVGGKGVIDQMAELSKQGTGGGMNVMTNLLSGSMQGSGASNSDQTADGGTRYRESQNDPISALVMDIAFPLMKPVIEEGVRRAQVTVRWKEGDREMTFELVQFLVSENQIILPDMGEDDAGIAPGTTPGTTAPGTMPKGSTAPAR